MGRHSGRNDSGRNDTGRNDTDGDAVTRVPEGARVLVARSPDRAGDLVAALRKVGADPLLLPLIDFELARDQHSLDVAFDALGAGAYAWLVISSVTTVQALEAKAAERGTTLSRWLPGSLLVATIGPATRLFLESRGVVVDLAPTGQQSGAGLLDIWPEHQGSVLLPQADIADPRLRRGLQARGAFVQAVTAYRTVDYPADPRRSLAACQPATPNGYNAAAGADRDKAAAVLTPEQAKAEIGAGRLAAVVAASPSAARRIHEDLAPLGGCRFVAIGRSTAAEAESLGLAVAAVAEAPTASGLVAAVVRSLAAPPSPPPQPAAEPTAPPAEPTAPPAEPTAKDTV
ncbi:uroporphyrinogen-III synthase [Arthrobacter sp. AL12]|uniref:uroporphyrinogen-III synthase n=1 Tax=Arthrobacter sp. AL12 TaxID=3042241 RepID=UPI002499FF4F|nr:uroporphyrinogen-III synthase [Arthrobacter sp. AL12]MDI3212493.1 uroporphyrinogen-III synthase [Arthrobacter sp. AL12]